MYRFFKKIIVFAFATASLLAVYIIYTNRNSVNMTPRQKILKTFYPVWMWFGNLTKKNTKELSNKDTTPPVSFYSLQDTLINGSPFQFSQLKGKKVLLVNTASNCGYTDQYDDLQKLHELNKDKLIILGFPANDFKEQEKGSNEEIAQFCKMNYGVNFPLMQKSSVVKSNGQNPVFKWLTDASQNGWNSKAPSWNFSKYLVNENGNLTHYFDPGISPLNNEIADALK